MTARASV